MAELLHIVVADLREDADASQLANAEALAADLASFEGATDGVVARTSTQLIAATWLARRDALDAFAAAPQHMQFIIEGLGRATSGMWSASVALDPPLEPCTATTSLLAFAVPGDRPAFEWQVGELLERLAEVEGPLEVHAGATIEERERFRAGGVLCAGLDAPELQSRIEAARPSLGPLADGLVIACAPVVTPVAPSEGRS